MDEIFNDISFLNHLIDNIDESIIVTDVNINIIYVNKAVETLFGYKKEELIGESPEIFNGDVNKINIQEEIINTVKNGDIYINNNIIQKRKDGSLFFSDLKVYPFKDKFEKSVFFISIQKNIFNIDRIKEYMDFVIRILEVLNRDNEKIDLLKELLCFVKEFTKCDSIGVRLKDDQGDYPYYYYDGFSDKFIYLENELLCHTKRGESYLACLCGKVLQEDKTNLDKKFFTEKGSFWSYDLDDFNNMYDGKFDWLRGNCIKYGYKSIALVPLRYDNKVIGLFQINFFNKNRINLDFVHVLEGIGEAVGVVLIKKKRIEDFIYSQKILRKTMEELKNKNEELEQFAYVTSHDLQEPLRVISNYFQLVKDNVSYEDDNIKKYISYIQDSVNRMKLLIKELLDFYRIGKKDNFFEKVDINNTINEVCEDFELVMKETGAKVICSGKMPEVVGIKVRMKQLFYNLIGNAIKFRSDEKPLIYISFYEDDKYWTFSIKDNGIGIDPMYFDRIFGVFKRLYAREKYSGNGIGLALCQKIVETHGGQIWVESSLNDGSIFYFTLLKNINVLKKT